MYPRGRDEIGDLGRALDAMRIALAETFEALSSERDRLSAVFVSLEDAVIVVGSDGDVRFANPAAAELITPGGQPAEPLRPWVRRASHRGTIETDHVAIEDRVVAISARHLPAESAVLIVVRDRTEELRRDQAEREFVSNAAHELRNPIAGMSGAIEVLRSGAKDDPEARDHFLDRLATDVDRVARLTKSLLTLARMEAIGEGEADVVSVEMVLDESINTAEAPEGVELVRETDAEQDLVASADPVLLRQVVIGLLTNAYKHTSPPGTVTLRANRSGEGEIVIEVEDTGAGIPAAERDRVFERFYRGSGSLERDGFGLGLAIAKRMIDVMGGEITVDSVEGQGAPSRSACAKRPRPRPRSHEEARLSRGRILVADDEPSVRESVGYALKQEGFDVTIAEDGDDADSKIGHEVDFDLLVLDIMMPGKSGLDLCRDIRGRSPVPIILLTAKDAEVDKVVGLEVGADDYVTKPFSVRELLGRVRAQLRRRELDRVSRRRRERRRASTPARSRSTSPATSSPCGASRST